MLVTLLSRRVAALVLIASAVAGCDSAPASVACTPEPPAAVALTAPAAPAAAPAVAPVRAADGPAPSAAAVAPVPATAPVKAATRSASHLRIKRLVLAEGVEGREPVGGGRSVFKDGETDAIYAFVEVDNPEHLPGAIVVSFESPDGPALGNVRLPVGASPRWRTWAFSRAIKGAGEWTAVVRDAEGRVLAREPFSVTL